MQWHFILISHLRVEQAKNVHNAVEMNNNLVHDLSLSYCQRHIVTTATLTVTILTDDALGSMSVAGPEGIKRYAPLRPQFKRRITLCY